LHSDRCGVPDELGHGSHRFAASFGDDHRDIQLFDYPSRAAHALIRRLWSVETVWTFGSCPGGSGEFTVGINRNGSYDVGPEWLNNVGGSGTDYYYDAGTFSLIIFGPCVWQISISTNASASLATPVTFTSTTMGGWGETQRVTVYAPWLTWSVGSCHLSRPNFFEVAINGSQADTGPSQYGAVAGGGGVDHYTDSGIFNLTIGSDCDWSISINGSPPSPHGYWLVGSDGGIFSFGSAQFYGSTGSLRLQRPAVGIVPTPDHGGYWLDATDGGVFAFGDAGFYGSIPGLGLHPAGSGLPHSLNAPIVGMVPSADGGGYFMVASDGGVFAFGDARFDGSCYQIGGCSGSAVAVMPDRFAGIGYDYEGYWLVTQTGNVYAFGNIPNYGAPGSLGVPVTSAERIPDGFGYWILFGSGAISDFGDAGNFGSPGGTLGGLNYASAFFATVLGNGYWVTSTTGQVFNFGDAPNDGSMSGTRLNGAIIAGTGW
jgi:hypothetical protein